MSILTTPLFYYVGPVDNTNFNLDFLEPNKAGIELNANLNVASYTLEELVAEVSRALNATGQSTYTVTIDRLSRKITISADDIFNLLIATGSSGDSTVFSLIGFTGVDLTGLSSYTGDIVGTSYEPQFPLQSFVGFKISKESISTKVNESSSGEVEVVTFGTKRTMKFNIKYITNSKGTNEAYNTCAPKDYEQEAIDFMEFITDKNKLEFMIDKADTNTFDKILLEKTPTSKDGSGYELKEMYSQNMVGFFETGTLRFRKL